MKKTFTKLFAALALLAFFIPSMIAVGQTTYNFSSIPTTGWNTNGSTVTINGVSWTYSSSTYISGGANGIQVGSKNNPQTTAWTIQTPISSFGENKRITGVSITAKKQQNNKTATYDISVGGTSVQSGSLTTTATAYNSPTLSVTSGNIVVTMTGEGPGGTTGTGYVLLGNISVTYENTSGPATYTVTYNANNGTQNPPTYSHTEQPAGSYTVLPNTNENISFTYTGHTFDEWNTEADGSGDSYNPEGPNNTINLSGDVTLYAQWNVNTYTVNMPATDQYGEYTATSNAASGNFEHGSKVTLTYAPASGYENYVATWSKNGTPLSGNTFTIDSDATITVSVAPYVQPTEIEIIPNYTFWGKEATFSGDAYDELEGSKDNVTLNWTRGSGSTYANQNAMRFYKDNTLVFTAPTGYEIKSIVITFTTSQSDLSFSPAGYSLSGTTGTWTGSSTTVTMSRPSNASNYAQISKYVITIGAASSAIATTTTINVPANFDTDLYNGTAAGTLTASVTETESGLAVSGATVTWSSSNEAVATIAANGTVTLVSVGTTTITASYAGVEDEYKPSSDTYEFTVTDSSPLASIAALTAQSAGDYNVALTNALVTYVNGTNAYLEDASGAVMLYHCAGDLLAGDKITGTASVTYTVYNNLPEVTVITLAEGYTLTHGNTVTPTVVTIAELNEDITNYISRYVKIENATVTSAFSNRNSTIEQGGSSIVLRDQNNPGTLSTTANSIVTVTAHPSIYNSTNQIAVYEQSQIVVIPNVYISADNVNITSDATDGSITYEIENEPSPAGTLTATVVAGYTISNLHLETPANGAIAFTCDANTTSTARTAEVTLTYTYGGSKAQVTATMTITQAAYVPTPTSDPFVRISSLSDLTDGSIVVIAARYDTEHTNGYYAMQNTLSNGKATGDQFNSQTSGSNEILPTTIVNNEDDYYWVVSISSSEYTFTNAYGDKISYNTKTDFNLNGTNDDWTIESDTSEEGAMVAEYTGFVIKNVTTDTRGFAFNGSVFGAYATSNMAASGYNFFLDFFVQKEIPTEYTKTINAYSGNGGYYLIASPVSNAFQPSATLGFVDATPANYDLYYFDEAQEKEWINFKDDENHTNINPGFNIVSGKGYLYASKNGTTLKFQGNPYSGNGEVSLAYTTTSTHAATRGWNLIGNPFDDAAVLDLPYYRLNSEGSALSANAGTGNVAAMEGVFVYAYDEQEEEPITTATFTKSNGSKHSIGLININIINTRGNVADNAIIRFDEGSTMPKFTLRDDDTKVYIPMGDKDYAIVSSNGQGSMPVNFKAKEMGMYTISVETEGIDLSYLHLIDRLTGEDVNLLLDNKYSFIASNSDTESRFILSFNENGINANNETFAFQNGSDIIVNGEGELQIFDVMGRMVKNTTINGVEAIAMPQGVYIFKLNGNVQKIVVR